ncbi:hypothetical protein [Undibacterium squillarum]|uniref:Toxin-antitoxin system HicB family antitoxin n=1 Tax=Undibacterium squillarum TaxID=1131567 RepID=A0ABQ2XW77_9BURK|nr:hypothetical protein [Undibacterium squillarum]GGX37372.1 hypothetical protein GCM10010946_13990 [Undibacterium squillarum]
MASPNKKSFPLRIDPQLWQEIERLAAQELRSVNAQVEYLLREALAKRGRLPETKKTPLPPQEPEQPEDA